MLASRRRILGRGLVLGALAALGLIAQPQGVARADALADIQKAGVIRIAVPQDFPPFGSVGPDLKPLGYDVDVAALIANRMGVKLELVPVTSANRIPYLQTRKVDLVISSLGRNPDREKVIDFSAPYAPFYNGIFGPKDLKVEKVEDIAGMSVGVTRGSVEDLELSKVAPAGADIKRYEDNNSTISAFLSGQVKAIATGNVVAAAILARNPPKKPEVKVLIKNSPCSIGLNKDEPALLEKVNAVLAAARADGALDKISEKWLGLPLPADL